MIELGYLDAILLGVLQGLTEFLPVSSSAHLALVQKAMGLPADSETMLLFDVLAHLGTVVAIAIVFRREASRLIARLLAESSRSWQRPRNAWRIVMLAVAACVPTAVIGLTFQRSFEATFNETNIIGVCLIVTGAMLAATMIVPRPRRGWRRFNVWRAILVGIVQGLAILPGISRSGSTICVATYLGLRRRWAGEFSFLIAVPVIVGAVFIKIAKDVRALESAEIAALPWGPIAVGAVVSFVTGVFALVLLLQAVRRAKLHWFALYCWALGGLILFGGL